jgi:hypothetical protein
MRIGTKYHVSAARQHLTRELMDHGLMRRYVYPAVFLGAGKSEHVVIFVYGTPDRTE